MFDTIAEMLRGSAPDDLAHALGTDRTQTRRAMEIGLPALITGLRDKTLEPGGAQNLATMLNDNGAELPDDVSAYLSSGDPAQGAALLDVAFGDRGEPALSSLSEASGLSTRLLAQVMSVLAPLATGVLSNRSGGTPEGLRTYLGAAVSDLDEKGFGRVVDLVSPGGSALGAAETIVEPVDLDGGYDSTGVEVDNDVVIASDTSIVTDTPDTAPVGVSASATPDNVVAGAFPDALDNDTSGSQVVVPGAPTAAVAAAAPSGTGSDDTQMFTPIADDDPLDFGPDGAYDDGNGNSAMGWVWWVLSAVLLALVAWLVITQCSSDDAPSDTTATGDDNGAEVVDDTQNDIAPTPDPAVAVRQAALNDVLADYPDVTGEVIGTTAVLNGTVPDDRSKALVDQAARAVPGMTGAQNNLEVVSVEPAGYSLNDIISAQPELSTLSALLNEAGLGESLDGNGPFTLFAPTNEAFAAAQAQVAPLQSDRAALQALLAYHVINGQLSSSDIAALPTLSTLQTEVISVTVDGGAVRLNDLTSVILPDVAGRNGVIHIINSVLFPPSTVVKPPQELGTELSLEPIEFAAGSTDLSDAAKAELDRVVEFLLANPADIEIGGHTDADGDAALNQSLSQERADAVRDYLIEQGVPGESLTAVGFGEDSPIAPNDSNANKAKNRRIEFQPV